MTMKEMKEVHPLLLMAVHHVVVVALVAALHSG